ncbi:hypothetical protein KDX23_22830 [Burkholderia vietnamiensis]|uniref:hypothetical protein n=1 Tax=Burkholderia vietnamiensis TaxID=60552 RepID=UPI001B9B45D1|nr:hypothetical protein [Burkholderia vietnamiensis]MBR8085574.1 hypothetical protein [Burkholderia vietnamiensis]
MVRAKAKASAITHGLLQEPEFEANRSRLLTSDEAKATIAAKGWTNRALAEWWGCRAEYISKIIHDPVRKRHFDDAIRGLPYLSELREPAAK